MKVKDFFKDVVRPMIGDTGSHTWDDEKDLLGFLNSSMKALFGVVPSAFCCDEIITECPKVTSVSTEIPFSSAYQEAVACRMAHLAFNGQSEDEYNRQLSEKFENDYKLALQ